MSPSGAPPAEPETPQPASSPLHEIEFQRHPQTNRIIGARFRKPTAVAEKPSLSPKKSPEPKPSPEHEQRLARLEDAIHHLSKPRKRKVTRDENGRVSGYEDVE